METTNSIEIKEKIADNSVANSVYNFMDRYTGVWGYSMIKFLVAAEVGYELINDQVDLTTLVIGGTLYAGAEYLKDKRQDRKNQKFISDLEKTLNKTE